MGGCPPSEHSWTRTRYTKENSHQPYQTSHAWGTVKIIHVEVEFHMYYEYWHDDYIILLWKPCIMDLRLDIILGSIWFTIDDFILKSMIVVYQNAWSTTRSSKPKVQCATRGFGYGLWLLGHAKILKIEIYVSDLKFPFVNSLGFWKAFLSGSGCKIKSTDE